MAMQLEPPEAERLEMDKTIGAMEATRDALKYRGEYSVARASATLQCPAQIGLSQTQHYRLQGTNNQG
jgi:hypothetical protein